MARYSALLMMPLILAACGADPGGENAGTPAVDNTATTEVAGNLRSVSYDPAANQLVLSINGVHGNQQNVTYTRRADLDASVPGYQVYMSQTTPSDRHYTAIFTQSNDNRLVAGAVSDGGNDNRYFGGTHYARQGANIYSPYTGTDRGEVQYKGTYAGITNVASRGTDLLPVVSNPTGITPPRQADRITGTIVLNADFANGFVDAEIANRRLVDDVGSFGVLPNIALVSSPIDANGAFAGEVEYHGRPNQSIGNFAGIFGGNQATSVAGAVHLEEFGGDARPTLVGEEEYGVFVLTRCGAAGADSTCSTD